jgi:drug/metabolite transporter (DMT)-like permease
MEQNNSYLKWIFLLLLSLIWGSSFILIKKGLLGFGYVEAATIRLVSAGLVFCPWGVYHLRKIPKNKVLLVFTVSLLSMFIPAYLFSLSQKHISSSVAGMLNALTPMFTFIFSIILYKKTYHRLQIVGLFIGLLFSMILIFNSSNAPFTLNFYASLIIIATICYGLNINIVRSYLSNIPSFSLSAVTVTSAGLLALLFVLIPNYKNYNFTNEQLGPLGYLLVLGLVGTAFAQYLQNKLISISSSLFASTSTYIIPIVAIFWGIFDSENLKLIHIICMIGILGAVLLIRKDK